jgi:hypothetical protein
MQIIFVTMMITSCTSEKDAVDSFRKCLGPKELQAYLSLENLCDNFIKSNYPDLELNDGYRKFLDDSEDFAIRQWLFDSSAIVETNSKLKEAFGDLYDETQGSFFPLSDLTHCMQQASNSPLIDSFIEDKMSSGAMSTNIIAGNMNAHDIDPTKGLVRIFFISEVVFRLQFFRINPIQKGIKPIK